VSLRPPERLQFDLEFSEQQKSLGLGALRVRIGETPIWSNEEGRALDWTWIDLLEQLARSWAFLKYDETSPLRAKDSMLSLMSRGHVVAADSDIESGPEVSRETYIFVRRHNLATGIEGLYLPTLSLLREGWKMWVASLNVTRLLDFRETMQTLEELGDRLANHIALGEPQERSRLANAAWRNREPTTEAALQIMLGFPSWTELVPNGETLSSYFETNNDEEYGSGLLIAARMSAALPLATQRKIIELVRALPASGPSDLLKNVSEEAEAAVPNYVRRPHEQGAVLAQWARKKFGLGTDAKAEPADVLKRLGIDVKQHKLGCDLIDAVGSWDGRHGPAVIVNLEGEHAQSVPGRRATLAHELCHILVDRNGSLPASEVLGGNVPRQPEQRANAFAAEFLLPKSIVVSRLRAATDAMESIEEILKQFGVSRELAAWQIINAATVFSTLSSSEKSELRSWTSGARNSMFF
jgi:Zn-dependent peptidase ImmA (M78 family)